MAAVLRHWREASTLIIVTARQKGPEIKPHFVSSNGRPTSASSIKGKNLEVLLLKRNAKSKFMPNLYVFPGGVADDVDFSSEWISVFDLLGKDHRKRVFDFAQRGGQGAPMFSRVRDEQFRQIPTEIAFRICAIRETFEESGVLIAADNSVQKKVDAQQSWNGESWASYIQDTATASLKEWRKRVIADPRQFLHMCQELSLVPDVWSLYEWSNWLTPLQSNRRFDTAFFVCCLQGRPLVAEDEQEAVHSQWGSPHSSLQEYYQGRVGLAPPQVYELGRLLEFSAVPELLTFAWRRGEHRVDRWLPVRVTTADNVMSVLPGDSLHPADVDPEGPPIVVSHQETMARLDQDHPQKNRVLYVPDRRPADGGMLFRVACNVDLPGQQVAPRFSDSQFLEGGDAPAPSQFLEGGDTLAPKL